MSLALVAKDAKLKEKLEKIYRDAVEGREE